LSDFTDDHDRFTRAYLGALGIDEGWRCLDVGAGDGTIARWMSHQVAPSGRVVALDVDDERLAAHLQGTRVEVRKHDAAAAEPLPEAPYDLVHSRVLLGSLASKFEVLRRMIDAVAPDGILALGELDFTVHRPVEPDEAWDRVWGAFMRGMAQSGWDPAYGKQLPEALERNGLLEVQAETVSRYVPGGSLPCIITLKAIERARSRLSEVDRFEIDAAQDLLSDPRRKFIAPDFVMASGRAV
jgi:ubiquinone/menaquinone biosynthesis C-methylase UbiE